MKNMIGHLLEFADKLRNAHISYSLEINRYDAISVNVAVPGQRWEVDFLSDGTIEVEVFKSDGNIYDESKLFELFQNFSD